VKSECFEEDASAKAFSVEHHITLPQLFRYFEEEVFRMVRSLGKSPVVWQGLQDAGVIPEGQEERQDAQSAQGAHSAHGGRRASGDDVGDADNHIEGDIRRDLKKESTSSSRLRANESSVRTVPRGEVDKLTTGRGTEARRLSSSSSMPSSPQKSRADAPKTSIVQPWKCWSGLASRAAITAASHAHPVVMSACWYLDYDVDWTVFYLTDIAPSARATVLSYTLQGFKTCYHVYNVYINIYIYIYIYICTFVHALCL
jgi:hypothetical protein